ncbi:MAG: hypothetical protein HeimC2_24150 [Candidatus Heimdallarchaeota archaeon LC_2]|nr:MAG: hypothetical protein HeimC2_24150 [Candidatus Heimdallarchaeota archaeon LC_2]
MDEVNELATEINFRIMNFGNIMTLEPNYSGSPRDDWCFILNYSDTHRSPGYKPTDNRPSGFEPKDEYELSFTFAKTNDLHLIPQVLSGIADLININKITRVTIESKSIGRLHKDFFQPIKDGIKQISISDSSIPEIPQGLFRNLNLTRLDILGCQIHRMATNFGILNTNINNFDFSENRLAIPLIFDGFQDESSSTKIKRTNIWNNSPKIRKSNNEPFSHRPFPSETLNQRIAKRKLREQSSIVKTRMGPKGLIYSIDPSTDKNDED